MADKSPVAALFDCDGVIIDTEAQYSRFWQMQNERYLPNVPDMYIQIKGTTLRQIYDRWFPDQPELQAQLTRELAAFEAKMHFPYIAGITDFIRELKARGVKTALVTSSDNTKMANVFSEHPDFSNYFDVLVTADKVTRSKPDPQCYIKAAEELGVGRDRCFVFEDSFAGLQAGMSARMKVIGLATTNPGHMLKGKCHLVIPNFTGFNYERLLGLNLSVN
jgi:HAD superfamily hydrolase (TIGR01509 family)